jgi:hypothetical protein
MPCPPLPSPALLCPAPSNSERIWIRIRISHTDDSTHLDRRCCWSLVECFQQATCSATSVKGDWHVADAEPTQSHSRRARKQLPHRGAMRCDVLSTPEARKKGRKGNLINARSGRSYISSRRPAVRRTQEGRKEGRKEGYNRLALNHLSIHLPSLSKPPSATLIWLAVWLGEETRQKSSFVLSTHTPHHPVILDAISCFPEHNA